MSKFVNSFALLDDEEGDNVDILVDRLVKKVGDSLMHVKNETESSDLGNFLVYFSFAKYLGLNFALIFGLHCAFCCLVYSVQCIFLNVLTIFLFYFCWIILVLKFVV